MQRAPLRRAFSFLRLMTLIGKKGAAEAAPFFF